MRLGWQWGGWGGQGAQHGTLLVGSGVTPSAWGATQCVLGLLAVQHRTALKPAGFLRFEASASLLTLRLCCRTIEVICYP